MPNIQSVVEVQYSEGVKYRVFRVGPIRLRLVILFYSIQKNIVNLHSIGSTLLPFYYLDPLQRHNVIMHAVHFLGRERGSPVGESVLPVTVKERKGEGKSSISPRMKYGHARHNSVCPYERLNTLHLLFVYGQTEL